MIPFSIHLSFQNLPVTVDLSHSKPFEFNKPFCFLIAPAFLHKSRYILFSSVTLPVFHFHPPPCIMKKNVNSKKKISPLDLIFCLPRAVPTATCGSALHPPTRHSGLRPLRPAASATVSLGSERHQRAMRHSRPPTPF